MTEYTVLELLMNIPSIWSRENIFSDGFVLSSGLVIYCFKSWLNLVPYDDYVRAHQQNEFRYSRNYVTNVPNYTLLDNFWTSLRYDGKLSPGLKALGELPFAAWVQILAVIGIIELTVGKQDYENKVSLDVFVTAGLLREVRIWSHDGCLDDLNFIT